MAITLAMIKEKLDDLRMDKTPGTVDTNQEGLRAINGIIDHIYSRHEWESTLVDDTFKYYPYVYNYPLPSDFYCPVSVYPISIPYSFFRLTTSTIFDQKVRSGTYENLFSYEKSMQPKFKVFYPQSRSFKGIPTRMDSLNDGSFTWSVTGGFSNARAGGRVTGNQDLNVKWDCSGASGSLIGASTTGIDLSSYQEDGALFWTPFIPAGNVLTSVTLTGYSSSLTDAAHQFVSVATSRFDSPGFEQNDFNIMCFDLSTATKGASIDWTNITRLEFLFTLAGTSVASTQFRGSRLISSDPEFLNLRYYSKNMVYDVSTGTYSLHFIGDDDLDTINLPEESLDMLAYGAAWILLKEMGRTDKSNEYQGYFKSKIEELQEKYPSMRLEHQPNPLVLSKSLTSSPMLRRFGA